MDHRLITPKQTAERLTISRSLLSIWKRTGYGPRPVALSPARDAYLEAEVEAFIAERAADR